MEPTTIHKLPNETILHILEFLDGKSVQTATSVCKNWSDLIGSSTKAMAKLKLSWNRRNLPSKGDQLNWKHQNVEIRIGEYPLVGKGFFKDTMERIIEAINFSSTRKLTIATWEKCDILQIIKLLSKMPHLENLILILLTPNNDFDESKITQVTLAKLKTLEIYYYGEHNFVLKFIKADQLLELEIGKLIYGFSYDNIITDFIKNCSTLKKVSIDGQSFNEMIDSQQEFDFRLTSLKIEFVARDTFATRKFDKFLLHQSSELSDLRLYQSTSLSEQNVRAIFEIKGLSKLVILQCLPSSTEEFYKKLKSIPSLNELWISCCPINESVLKTLLEKFPNVEKMRLSLPPTNATKHLSINCPKLVEFSTYKAEGSLEPGKNLSCLKFLEVHIFSDDFVSLVNNSPSIESLDLTYISEQEITENALDPILQNPTLSHLILRVEIYKPHFEELKEVFVNKNFINDNSRKLKTLQVRFREIHDYVMMELMLDNTKWIPEKRDDVKIQVVKPFTEKKNKENSEQKLLSDSIPRCDTDS